MTPVVFRVVQWCQEVILVVRTGLSGCCCYAECCCWDKKVAFLERCWTPDVWPAIIAHAIEPQKNYIVATLMRSCCCLSISLSRPHCHYDEGVHSMQLLQVKLYQICSFLLCEYTLYIIHTVCHRSCKVSKCCYMIVCKQRNRPKKKKRKIDRPCIEPVSWQNKFPCVLFSALIACANEAAVTD